MSALSTLPKFKFWIPQAELKWANLQTDHDSESRGANVAMAMAACQRYSRDVFDDWQAGRNDFF